MTQHTLSLGPLSLLATQTGPLLTITIHAPSDTAPVGRMTLTVAEWTSLVALVDCMGAADGRIADLTKERDALIASMYSAPFDRSLVVEVCHDLINRAMRNESDEIPDWRSSKHDRDKEAAIRALIADRDSLCQQVRDLTAEHVRDALMVAALRARLAKAETQVQPDIFQLGNESDALRTEIAAIKIDRDEWRVQHDAAVECWREEVGRITAERDSLRQQLAAAQVELARIKEQDLPAELRERRALELHVDDESRCAVCGWPLAESVAKGCVRGNCSQRPRPENLYAPERAAKEQHKE